MKKISAKFTIEELKKATIWSHNKFILDPQSRLTAGRIDLFSAFLDRWINNTSQYLIFDEIMKDLSFNPFSDEFIYKDNKSKNAPDLLGLISKNITKQGSILPFFRLINGSWVKLFHDAPFVEVKSFKKLQKLITLPEMNDDYYYLLCETEIDEDYIVNIFSNDFFNDEKMDDILTSYKYFNKFIDPSSINDVFKLSDLNAVQKSKNVIGEIKLIGTFLGKDLKKIMPLFSGTKASNDQPKHLSGITDPSDVKSSCKTGPKIRIKPDEKIFDYNKLSSCPNYKHPFIPVRINLKSEIYICSCTWRNSSPVLHVHNENPENKFNNQKLKIGISRIDQSIFDKRDSRPEHIAGKSLFDDLVIDDETENLINDLEKIWFENFE